MQNQYKLKSLTFKNSYEKKNLTSRFEKTENVQTRRGI